MFPAITALCVLSLALDGGRLPPLRCTVERLEAMDDLQRTNRRFAEASLRRAAMFRARADRECGAQHPDPEVIGMLLGRAVNEERIAAVLMNAGLSGPLR